MPPLLLQQKTLCPGQQQKKSVMKCLEELHFHEVKRKEHDKNFQYVEAYLSCARTISQSEKEDIQKRWVGREEKQIASRGKGEEEWWWRRRWQDFRSCLYLSLFSWTAGECLSMQCHHFWQYQLPPSNALAGRANQEERQEKWGISALNSCPPLTHSLTHHMPIHRRNKAPFICTEMETLSHSFRHSVCAFVRRLLMRVHRAWISVCTGYWGKCLLFVHQHVNESQFK